ncbi:DUF6378 domain-containing protein [Elioraea sp.]|uniref:DUF6378 domain-containing protein n=1 Tax=Elioraea sp. TaxID=2185103 RepID=UPI0025C26E76|nr:DUF6378 domain-containing protein [Elioraea sp.]
MTSGVMAGAIAREAADIVEGARNAQHGDKERSFAAIAGLWNAYLSARKAGGPIGSVDVAHMMALLKIARSVQGQAGFRDHYVDAVGYAAIAGELALDAGAAPADRQVAVNFPEHAAWRGGGAAVEG